VDLASITLKNDVSRPDDYATVVSDYFPLCGGYAPTPILEAVHQVIGVNWQSGLSEGHSFLTEHIEVAAHC
jgi:hypothetical protein